MASGVLFDQTTVVHFVGFLGMLCSARAAISKSDMLLRKMMSASAIAWAIYNFLLGAYTATAIWLVISARTGSSAYITSQPKMGARVAAFLGFYALSFGLTVMTWQGLISLAPLAASLIGCYAMFFLSGNWLRFGVSLTMVCQIINALYFGAYAYLAITSVSLMTTWLRIVLNLRSSYQ